MNLPTSRSPLFAFRWYTRPQMWSHQLARLNPNCSSGRLPNGLKSLLRNGLNGFESHRCELPTILHLQHSQAVYDQPSPLKLSNLLPSYRSARAAVRDGGHPRI